MYQKITINRGKVYRLIHKTWLIMRLTTAILIATLMQVSAIGKAQKITLAKQNAPLKQVIIELRKQSGYDFIVTGSVFEHAKPISINVKNKDFEEALQLIFDKQPIEYNIEDKTVTLKIKKPGFFEELVARFQSIDVRGMVLDEKGAGLPGATVKVKSTGKGVLTDGKGEFYLKNVEENEVLVVTYLGYVAKEVVAKAELGDIALEMSDSKLDAGHGEPESGLAGRSQRSI